MDLICHLKEWQSLIAGILALLAAWWTVMTIRRQTDLPIKNASRDRLLRQKAALETMKAELAITVDGLKRLQKDGAEGCAKDLKLARLFMPFWLHFPKIFDLRETTLVEVEVDFGLGGAEEFTAVRERLRQLLRLNYSVHRDAVGHMPEEIILKLLDAIGRDCGVAINKCEKFDRKLDELIVGIEAKLKQYPAIP